MQAEGNVKQYFQDTVFALEAHCMRLSMEFSALSVVSTLKSLRIFGAFLIFRLEIFSLYKKGGIWTVNMPVFSDWVKRSMNLRLHSEF